MAHPSTAPAPESTGWNRTDILDAAEHDRRRLAVMSRPDVGAVIVWAEGDDVPAQCAAVLDEDGARVLVLALTAVFWPDQARPPVHYAPEIVPLPFTVLSGRQRAAGYAAAKQTLAEWGIAETDVDIERLIHDIAQALATGVRQSRPWEDSTREH